MSAKETESQKKARLDKEFDDEIHRDIVRLVEKHGDAI